MAEGARAPRAAGVAARTPLSALRVLPTFSVAPMSCSQSWRGTPASTRFLRRSSPTTAPVVPSWLLSPQRIWLPGRFGARSQETSSIRPTRQRLRCRRKPSRRRRDQQPHGSQRPGLRREAFAIDAIADRFELGSSARSERPREASPAGAVVGDDSGRRGAADSRGADCRSLIRRNQGGTREPRRDPCGRRSGWLHRRPSCRTLRSEGVASIRAVDMKPVEDVVPALRRRRERPARSAAARGLPQGGGRGVATSTTSRPTWAAWASSRTTRRSACSRC